MQSEPSTVFNRSPPVKPFSEELLDSTQHGHDSHGEQRVSGFRDGEPRDHSLSRDSSGALPPLNGHSATSPPLEPSSIDPVTQYEIAAAAQSSRSPADRGLKVVPSVSTYSGVSLDSFPNEVLTHILSHLPPPSLSSIALVSRRFHNLVTTPHAWRIAFSRYFPGPYTAEDGAWLSVGENSDRVTSDKRYFSRLTALASWRSEYILRTRLLRSLSRGKPGQFEPSKRSGTIRSANVRNGSAVVTYTSQLLYPVSHLHGSFGSEVTKKEPLFIHGASEQGIACASDPSAVKVGTWGLSDHQMFRHFADLFPGDAEYGLGSGDLAGMPNRMDVSQPYGMIYGEACPQGRTYFISTTEQRGRFLGISDLGSQPRLGIPAINHITSGTTAVWIAKSSNILKMTDGLVAMLSGSSTGILSAYALGPHPTYEKRYERGQVTAKWALCPGVPIVAIAVDESFSPKRYARRRIWATVLNALGEVFYLSDLPRQPDVASTKLSAEEYDELAWKTGRSVRWELVELTRRTARPDPFSREPLDGSYSPRSSCDAMKLDEKQVTSETKEIERFLSFKPKHFRKVCEGWDMRRELTVDFAGDDGRGAGESILVISRGIGEDETAAIRRYTRKVSKLVMPPLNLASLAADGAPAPSLFGGPVKSPIISASVGTSGSSTPSQLSNGLGDTVCTAANTEWYISDFNFSDRKSVQITTTAVDRSTYALLTADEDPLIGLSGSSAFSSAMSSPLPHLKQTVSNNDVPGQRGRYLAVGTTTGMVFVWDIRSPASKNSEIVNDIGPIRVIQTESPQVSSVALTSLYLVHGGNDGLVQAWDPLASSTRPIRTINSRFSSRARRRLVQAEASMHGVGNNYYATGAICLDTDPTVLRGMVALGTHLRYWSYSSSGADQYKTSKRRLRRGPRGSNVAADGGQRFSNSGRGALNEYIQDERVEMERQRIADEKQRAHLSQRFGVDLLGPDISEDQMLAYAQLLSEESFSSEAFKRGDVAVPAEFATASSAMSTSSDTIGFNESSLAPDELSSASSPYDDPLDNANLDPDIAEAIRLSLLDQPPKPDLGPPAFDSGPHSTSSSPQASTSPVPESSRQQEIDDLEFAIQLSLAEAESQQSQSRPDEFPALAQWAASSPPPLSGRDKGKGRAS
ncbi:F-box and WD domain protein [Aspergillus saccharolyticus JOP 1030-1]|uniref:F-box and WD domain protein n=1 Tax=Aspergillus saccharolyticus JOP 1030-1 TaxID=1450539 RepID=A0A318ZLC2_9EURO|nr:F-box and WD domain protein [Aspergillus saccharolyticus JOP 1030-1]PYH48316.1 F-box and WD domain protein [Aspergillus saccharolyticus JOP 1030-1]